MTEKTLTIKSLNPIVVFTPEGTLLKISYTKQTKTAIQTQIQAIGLKIMRTSNRANKCCFYTAVPFRELLAKTKNMDEETALICDLLSVFFATDSTPHPLPDVKGKTEPVKLSMLHSSP
ncbi:MAG: hypothetical protein NWE93_11310 [Candidatus Bathyarchaeota archaeon]|nr:hypothetical protein [Candidatus Bathyarchaeota archaeon]